MPKIVPSCPLLDRIDPGDRELLALHTLMEDRRVSRRDIASLVGWNVTRVHRTLAGERQATATERRLLRLAITEPEVLTMLRGTDTGCDPAFPAIVAVPDKVAPAEPVIQNAV